MSNTPVILHLQTRRLRLGQAPQSAQSHLLCGQASVLARLEGTSFVSFGTMRASWPQETGTRSLGKSPLILLETMTSFSVTFFLVSNCAWVARYKETAGETS